MQKTIFCQECNGLRKKLENQMVKYTTIGNVSGFCRPIGKLQFLSICAENAWQNGCETCKIQETIESKK